MYVPVSYWQSPGQLIAHMNGLYFSVSSTMTSNNIDYTYDNIAYTLNTGSIVYGSRINSICLDVINQSSINEQPNYYLAGGSFFCSAEVSGTIGVNAPPRTGPEAWVIDVKYFSNFDDGAGYYSYVNKDGIITNDTISFGQTKRIISQTNPLQTRGFSNLVDLNIKWDIVEKYPGQVIPYEYYNVPARYTFQIKRDNPSNPGTYAVPFFSRKRLNFVNGAPQITNSGSVLQPTGSYTLNSLITVDAINPPISLPGGSTDGGPLTWITNVTPYPIGAYNISSCENSSSLWVTLNNYNFYNTGSVLKVTNSQLTSTSSCWVVTNYTSSVSVSVALADVNVSQSYAPGACILCLSSSYQPIVATGGSSSGSFIEGFTTYTYNVFTSSGNFVVNSGSVSNARILVVAGGGGGGNAGGGAGGCVYSSSFNISQSTYVVTIGLGGKGVSAPGSSYLQDAVSGTNTTFSGSNGIITAIGGGYGSQYSGIGTAIQGANGGSGGGGLAGITGGSPGQGTIGQGFDGGLGNTAGRRGGGGGGAGQYPGSNNNYGGIGRELGTHMIGSIDWVAGGGNDGGGVDLPYVSGSEPGDPGAGGRGGGGATPGQSGSNGIVIITYPTF